MRGERKGRTKWENAITARTLTSDNYFVSVEPQGHGLKTDGILTINKDGSGMLYLRNTLPENGLLFSVSDHEDVSSVATTIASELGIGLKIIPS